LHHFFDQLLQCGPNSQNLTQLSLSPYSTTTLFCMRTATADFLRCSLMYRQASRSQWWNSKTPT